jgi:hypothetical protein
MTADFILNDLKKVIEVPPHYLATTWKNLKKILKP